MDEARARQDIDTLITTFFSAFDNRRAPPALGTLLACFADKAVITRGAGASAEVYTVSEFAAPRMELLTQGVLTDFHEAETSATTHVFGAIATRTSRYEKSGHLRGQPYTGAGTKCFQLVALEGGWRIAALAWTDDAG